MWDLEHLTCRDCGQPYDTHDDPERDWYAYRTVDYAAMALAGAQAQWDALHKDRPYHDGSFTSWAEDRSPAHPYHYNDGVSIYIAAEDVAPDDEFLSDERAMPQKPPL